MQSSVRGIHRRPFKMQTVNKMCPILKIRVLDIAQYDNPFQKCQKIKYRKITPFTSNKQLVHHHYPKKVMNQFKTFIQLQSTERPD